jgi:hypothetical protein
MANELVIAFKNQGKSTLGLHIARMNRKPIIAFDEHEVFTRVGHVVDLDELEDYITDGLKRNDFLVYVPSGENEQEEFNEFCARIWKPANVTILIDEASYIQTSGHAAKYLKKLLRLNEEIYNVSLVQCTHRATELSTVSRSQSWDWYILFTPDPGDIRVIRDRWGDEVANAVQQLDYDSHHYVHVSATLKGKYEVITDSDSWYENLRPKEEIYNG